MKHTIKMMVSSNATARKERRTARMAQTAPMHAPAQRPSTSESSACAEHDRETTGLPDELGEHLGGFLHRLEGAARLGLDAVIGRGEDGGGGREVERRAGTDLEAFEEVEGGLHRAAAL